MITRKKLTDVIADNGGKWEPEPKLIFKKDAKDDTIHVSFAMDSGSISGLLMKHHGEHMDNFYVNGLQMERIGDLIEFMKKLGKWLEFVPEIPGATVVEKLVVSIAGEMQIARLESKVEVYEKLTTGRTVSLG